MLLLHKHAWSPWLRWELWKFIVYVLMMIYAAYRGLYVIVDGWAGCRVVESKTTGSHCDFTYFSTVCRLVQISIFTLMQTFLWNCEICWLTEYFNMYPWWWPWYVLKNTWLTLLLKVYWINTNINMPWFCFICPNDTFSGNLSLKI